MSFVVSPGQHEFRGLSAEEVAKLKAEADAERRALNLKRAAEKQAVLDKREAPKAAPKAKVAKSKKED